MFRLDGRVYKPKHVWPYLSKLLHQKAMYFFWSFIIRTMYKFLQFEFQFCAKIPF